MPADEPRVIRAQMSIAILRLGGGYIATAELAGVQFRGNRKRTAVEALRDIFLQLTQEQNLDANLAADLAASGETYAIIAAELPGRPSIPDDKEATE